MWFYLITILFYFIMIDFFLMKSGDRMRKNGWIDGEFKDNVQITIAIISLIPLFRLIVLIGLLVALFVKY